MFEHVFIFKLIIYSLTVRPRPPLAPCEFPPPNSRYIPHFSFQNHLPPMCNPKSKSLSLSASPLYIA